MQRHEGGGSWAALALAAALLLSPATPAGSVRSVGLPSRLDGDAQDAPTLPPAAATSQTRDAQPVEAQAAASPLVSLDRIREGLERAPQPVLKMPRPPDFSVTVEGQLPRIEAFITNESLRRGPSMPTSVTHQEFLSMVTPSEARSYQSFSPGELAVVGATSLAFAYAASTLPRVLKQAWHDRQIEQARKEVAAVLAELQRQERERAGAAPVPPDAAEPPASLPPP